MSFKFSHPFFQEVIEDVYKDNFLFFRVQARFYFQYAEFYIAHTIFHQVRVQTTSLRFHGFSVDFLCAKERSFTYF